MNGWDEFEAYMREARLRMEDRWAPVALICLQVRPGTEGAAPDVWPEKDGVILWPSSFPVPERGPLLTRLAKPYLDGTVLREPAAGLLDKLNLFDGAASNARRCCYFIPTPSASSPERS